MDHDRATESGLKRLFSPRVLHMVVFIRWEILRSEFLFNWFAFLSFIMYVHLLVGGTFCLVLQVESYRLLEVDLDGTALVLAVERIVHLHIDLWSIEGSITMIKGPGHFGFF